MYHFTYILHNKNGDNMNIDIRKSIISKIKNDDENSLINIIDETVISNNELALPGLGVILELFWKNLNKTNKENIARIIKANLK